MIDFTGERFVPTESGEIRYEHLHRYAWAAGLCQGKDVLDLASGEGYGSALLAGSARSVLGVDLSPAAVAHARRAVEPPVATAVAGVPVPAAIALVHARIRA